MALGGTPVDNSNISQLKDVLQTYNRVTEECFKRCAANFNYRNLTSEEDDDSSQNVNRQVPMALTACVESCCAKFISGNQKIMSTFVEIQSRKQQQMIEEAAKEQQNMLNVDQQQITDNLPVPDNVTVTDEKVLNSPLASLNLAAEQSS